MYWRSGRQRDRDFLIGIGMVVQLNPQAALGGFEESRGMKWWELNQWISLGTVIQSKDWSGLSTAI